MAALTPSVVVRDGVRIPTDYLPREDDDSFAIGSVSVRIQDGYLYTPPTEGQLWPRGDYAPIG